MKFISFLFLLIFLQNCSFDNRSGIWKNENIISNKDDNIFKEFKKLSSSSDITIKEKEINPNFNFNFPPQQNNSNWKDVYYNENNNLINFKYNNSNKIIFKTKKLTRFDTSDFILYEEGNIITTDIDGNIIIFSVDLNRTIQKYNFYKKEYKRLKKKLNIIVQNNIIYVSDNIGYLYAYNYIENKVLWAKNYKIPFRSNLKITKDKLIAANQNNHIYFFNKFSGDMLRLIPTEETVIKNYFKNNILINNENTFFLNTYGSLYSINNNDMRINWFINLNQAIDLNPSNLFTSTELVSNNGKIIVSSNKFTYVVDTISGKIIFKHNFNCSIKPLIIKNNLFLITKNHFLVAINLIDGEIIYSHDMNKKIAEFLNTKKRKVDFKNMMFAKDKIYIFLKNSYFIILSLDGKIEEINKLPNKSKTYSIFVNETMVFLNNDKRAIILD